MAFGSQLVALLGSLLLLPHSASLHLSLSAPPPHRKQSDSTATTALHATVECPNRCNMNGRCLQDGTCDCFDGYTGESCSERVPECAYNSPGESAQNSSTGSGCGEHGTCMPGGVCMCRKGYAGFRCRYAKCEHMCSRNGLCYHKQGSNTPTCLCLGGYKGETCEESPCPRSCFKHGHCVVDGKGQATCRCNPGWSGEACQYPTCRHACEPHGTCVRMVLGGILDASVVMSSKKDDNNKKSRGRGESPPPAHDLALDAPISSGAHRCSCLPGWEGEDCSRRKCRDSCNGRGKCMKSGICLCEEGFFGVACEHSEKICPNQCMERQGRGNCTESGCNCLPRFGGRDCSLACSKSCLDQGLECIAGECQCIEGFTGPDCTERMCRQPCLNDGICVDGECRCHAPYAGSQCQMKVCENDCNGRGDCLGGTCHCMEGAYGDACESLACPNLCTNAEQGECDPRTGKCSCRPPFFGPDCSHYTCDKTCSFHGDCIDGTCTCDPGWAGDKCEKRIEAMAYNGEDESGIIGTSHHHRRNDSTRLVSRGGGTASSQSSSATSSPAMASGGLSPSCSHDNDCLARLERGVCQEGTCVCNSAFFGDFCEHRTCAGKSLSVAAGPNKDVFCLGRGKCSSFPAFASASTPAAKDDEFHNNDDEAGEGREETYKSSFHSSTTSDENRHHQASSICACHQGFYGDNCEKSYVGGEEEGGDGNPFHSHKRGSSQSNSSLNASSSSPPGESLIFNDTTCIQPCTENGVCHNGECLCADGWFGDRCEKMRCRDDCNGFGECLNVVEPNGKIRTECKCSAGRVGEACEEEVQVCPNDCSNHGDCLQTSGGGMFCDCDAGFSGPSCNDTLCGRPCSQHGVCLNDRCYCDYGYLGSECEIVLCPNNCSTHGVCQIPPPSSSFSSSSPPPSSDVVGCQCDPGWSGVGCDVRIGSFNGCTDECEEHGTCQRNALGDHLCVCDKGWGGQGCSLPQCSGSGGCGEHGSCVAPGVCKCHPGFDGPECDLQVCRNQCSRHGLCDTVHGKCECFAGYSGDDCSRAGDCATGSTNCVHGMCIGGACECETGYFGGYCEHVWCPKGCGANEGRGRCRDGFCVCNDGFFGAGCDHSDRAMCLVECERRCSPLRNKGQGVVRHGGGGAFTADAGEAAAEAETMKARSHRRSVYNSSLHSVGYSTKQQCFHVCSAECDAAANRMGDGLMVVMGISATSGDDDGESQPYKEASEL